MGIPHVFRSSCTHNMSRPGKASENSLSGRHVVLALFFVKFSLLLGSRILILLVLRNQIVHVRLGLSELHLVHALARVPVQKSFTAEHGSEVLCDTLEHFLNRSRITCEGHRHFQTLGGDVANTGFDVVWNPFHEVGGILVLYIQHLLVHFLCAHASSEQAFGGEIAPVSWVCRAHHVLCVEHLLRQLWYCESTILLRPTRCERGESSHEEVKAWERDEIDSNLAQIAVQLPRKAQACCHAAHCCAHKVVQITISWCRQLQSAEANVVKRFVVEQEALVCVLHKLVK